MKRRLSPFLAFAFAGALQADVKLPVVFTDHLVLQNGKPVPVWGWADAGEEVEVTFAGQTKKTTAAKNGTWSVKLDSLKVNAEPDTLTVKGNNEIVLKDVLVGEVWICSGQSNMQWTVKSSNDPDKEIAEANHPQIRLLTVPRAAADEPKKDLPDTVAWKVCSPETIAEFSAVGYFFGRELNKELKVPVGLINTSWGGTRAEAWTSKPALSAEPSLRAIQTGWDQFLKNYDADAQRTKHEEAAKARIAQIAEIKAENAKPDAVKKPVPAPVRPFENQRTTQHRPSVLFNAMVSPLIPYAAKGAIWYQGESNQQRAVQYQTLLPALIADWRNQWEDNGLSFYVVQLAGYGNNRTWPQPDGTDDTWAELQWAQWWTVSKVKNTGLAVANDIGEEKDIHPRNKQEVGRRLALQALSKDYKKKDITANGPTLVDSYQSGRRIMLSFTNANGLTTRDGGEVKGLIICGADKVWKPATSKILKGESKILVWNDEVLKPVAVRYAWAAWSPEANLVNKEGLPAGLFRTDKFELSTTGSVNPHAPRVLPPPGPAPAPAPAEQPKKEEAPAAAPVSEKPAAKAA